MEFLKYKNYEDMFTNRGGDLEHYHCDVCEKAYPTRAEALSCCWHTKDYFIAMLQIHNINVDKLLKKIDKLDYMFQKKEFGKTGLCGSEFYPFRNIFFEEDLHSKKIKNTLSIVKLSTKECYEQYENKLKQIANKIILDNKSKE